MDAYVRMRVWLEQEARARARLTMESHKLRVTLLCVNSWGAARDNW
jgi:hypothetical protein